jgi:hypothetical protein
MATTKSETIKSLVAACARVLKQSDFAGGVATALTLVITRLSGLRDQIVAAGEIDPNISTDMWNELYECGKILDTVYSGFPMVPAEDVATLTTDAAGEDMGTDEMVNMCVTTLEKAAETKGIDAGLPVAVVKSALDQWAALGETDPEIAKVRVLKDEALVKLAKACGDKKMSDKAKPAGEEAAKAAGSAIPVEPTVDEQRIANIAKSAIPNPAPPAPPSKTVVWPY